MRKRVVGVVAIAIIVLLLLLATGVIRTPITKEEQAEGSFEALGFVGAGMTEYDIYSDSNNPVVFGKAIVDPLDAKVGDEQTLTVKVKSVNGIEKVTASTQLDNEFLTLDLKKTGVEDGYDIYSTSWKVYDTHVTTYRTRFTATDNQGNSNNINLTWTDSCSGLNQGTDYELTQPCTIGINSVAGLDSGSIIIAQNTTLTLNSGSTFVWTPGNTVTVSGSIASSGNGALKKGYIFYSDADDDGYADSSSLVFHASPTGLSATQFVRAKDSVGIDCYGGNPNARPGQTAFFTTHRGDGSFDYNCDGNGDGGSSSSSSGGGVCNSYPGLVCPSDPSPSQKGSAGWTTVVQCGNQGTYVSDAGGCFPPGEGEAIRSCVSGTQIYTCTLATKQYGENGRCHSYTDLVCPSDPDPTKNGAVGFTSSLNCGQSGTYVSDAGGCFPTPGAGGTPRACITETITQSCR